MIRRQVGVLGGTFDPVHLGHLQLAESALAECGLDKILFIPSAHPPHKKGTAVTPFAHRVAMLKLANRARKDFACDLIEAQLPKPSYTIDTLKILQNLYRKQARLFFILGADAFLDLATWKEHDRLLQLVGFIISLRRGYQGDLVIKMLLDLGYTAEIEHRFTKEDTPPVCILKSSPLAISSSALRAMVANGESIRGFVPAGIESYIQEHSLYRPDTVDMLHET